MTKKQMKRSNGEGSVYRDAERGGWVGQLTIDGRRRKVRAPTKTDVLAKLNKLRHDAAEGNVITDGNATVGQLLELWRTRTLPNRDLQPSSLENYQWTLPQLVAEFGSVRLRGLTVQRIEQGFDRIASGGVRGNPLSRRSLKMMRSTLAQALDDGVRRRLIAHNPARIAELTPSAAQPKDRRSLTRDEAQKLWAGCDDNRLGNLFKLMLLTGLRPGEAIGLCWDAVDLDAGLLHVRRSVRNVRNRAVLVDALKTANSWRTIALPAPAVDVLRAQRRDVVEMKLAAGVWATVDHELVFPTKVGTPWNLSNVRDELDALCEATGVARIVPHELRHSAASILSDQGVPLELIADLLGHSDTTMLARTYRHRLRPSADAAVVVMENLFGSV